MLVRVGQVVEHLLVMPLTSFEMAKVLVLMLLSGGSTPVESQPKWLRYVTYLLPARHFVSFSQVIIYRGGGLGAVWRQFLMVAAVGVGFFVYSLALFRKSIAVSK
ncbi:ABC transporter permease [Corallococcus exercitus]|uniref:ABC transporter permease n=1 Tax=Corallococcus exercitus TaxID=2316736 RepID=UPI0035D43F75